MIQKSISIKMMERSGEKTAQFMTQSATLSVKNGASSVMTCARMAAKQTGTLAFVNDFTADVSNRMNTEIQKSIL